MDAYILIALIGLLAGLVKGISGFGSSLVTIPLLTMVLGTERIGDIIIMMITFNVLLNTLLMFENKGFSIKSLKNVYLITISGIIFSFVGILLRDSLEVKTIELIAACLIILAVIVKTTTLYFKPIKVQPNWFTQILVGSLSGVGNGIASIDGPPVVFYLSGTNAEKAVFKNTLATHFLVMGIWAVVITAVKGDYSSAILIETGYITGFAVVGLVIGMLISKRLNEKSFQTVVLGVLILLALKMIFL